MSVILVVDDDPTMVDLIQNMVHLGGYETEVAYSGLEGLDKAREGMPDLILVDILMPGMDGWEVYHRLREFSSIPVIFVTQSNTAANEARALQMGAEGLLPKDVNPLQLAQQIQFVLDGQKQSKNGTRTEYLH